MKLFLSCITLCTVLTIQSQEMMNDSLPYATIPEAPETYTAGSVVARMLDGLGFRYHWATEGLTDTELDYEPANEGRSIRQTLTHIHGLSEVVLNAAKKQATLRPAKDVPKTFAEIRRVTLENLKTASVLLLETKDLGAHAVIFKRGEKSTEFPFWNNINGPIEDAVWHTGQIVLLRRSAGNPINPKVNVFLGKLNE